MLESVRERFLVVSIRGVQASMSIAEREQAVCPNKDQHTTSPDGYLAWHDWAERKSKTHRQKKCPGCGYWMIWVPKKSGKGGLTK